MSETYYSSPSGEDIIPNARTLRFRGINGTECEDFVQSVRFIALTEGKEDDDRWMLNFATARLSGRALRWHARLDKETRKDWDRLVRALLDEYTVDAEEDAPAVTAAAPDLPNNLTQNTVELSAPVPVGGGPLEAGLHVGRIRVVPKLGPTTPLYLSALSNDGSLPLTNKKTNALSVQFLQSKEPHEIDIVQLECEVRGYGEFYYRREAGRRLAIEGSRVGKQGWVYKVRSNYFSSGSSGVWPLKCWLIGSDNVLGVLLHNTATHVQSLIVLQYHQCYFVENYGLWVENNPNVDPTHYEANLVFEPLVETF